MIIKLLMPVFIRLLKECLNNETIRPLIVDAVKNEMKDTVKSVLVNTMPDTLVKWINNDKETE